MYFSFIYFFFIYESYIFLIFFLYNCNFFLFYLSLCIFHFANSTLLEIIPVLFRKQHPIIYTPQRIQILLLLFFPLIYLRMLGRITLKPYFRIGEQNIKSRFITLFTGFRFAKCFFIFIAKKL